MSTRTDAFFSGVIGREYDMLKRICPLAPEMSRLVGEAVAEFCRSRSGLPVRVLELGGGTGITTLAILSAGENVDVLSVDHEPVMQDQARSNLRAWVERERLHFSCDDALTALREIESASFDVVASAYTLHNFESAYRRQVIEQIFRVLKPGGCFVNGDRYGLDDIDRHTALIQREVEDYFRILLEEQRPDLLKQWILHLFSDESENHVMREGVSLRQLADAGFNDIRLSHRTAVNALVTAGK